MEYSEKQQSPPPAYPGNEPAPHPQQPATGYPPQLGYPQQPGYAPQSGYPPQQPVYPTAQPGYTSSTTVVVTQPYPATTVIQQPMMPNNTGAIIFSCFVYWCFCCVLGFNAFIYAGKVKEIPCKRVSGPEQESPHTGRGQEILDSGAAPESLKNKTVGHPTQAPGWESLDREPVTARDSGNIQEAYRKIQMSNRLSIAGVVVSIILWVIGIVLREAVVAPNNPGY